MGAFSALSPLLGLQVRNPCQPWVCSWWCDGGESEEETRPARMLGARGGGGAWDPPRDPLSYYPPALSLGLVGHLI